MKFYYSKSACSLAVRIILNELGFTHENVEVDLRAKKTKSGEDYWAINPKGAVPALQLDSGDVLTEVQVILQYLADQSKGQKLLAPIGDLTRYRTLEWLNFVATEMHKSIGAFFNPVFTDEVKSTMLMPIVLSKLKFVNAHLEHHHYLMGTHFTLPDAYLFVVLRWTAHLKIDLEKYPHIALFMKRVRERPSVIESLNQEQ